MKIGFICPNLPGHINPMSALARHLQARGHDVMFLYSSSANGLPCIPGDRRDDLNANRPEISKLEGNEALAFYCGVAAKETETIFKSLPRMLEKTGVEALVLDPIQFFVELAAMKLRIPYVTVVNASQDNRGANHYRNDAESNTLSGCGPNGRGPRLDQDGWQLQ
jgi:zeaxanthin glucosyltransferase